MSLQKQLIVLVGPTAVGKTKTSVFLAEKYKAVVLSADSRQFYKPLNIGTAKPTEEDKSGIPHHFINNLDIHEYYSAGKFEMDVLNFLAGYFQENQIAILTGGSGLYINAVCTGIDAIPGPDPVLRDRLTTEFKSNGLANLLTRLGEADPEYFSFVDKKNPARIIRALEVIELTGKKYSELRGKKMAKRPFNTLKIGLELPKEELYNHINRRVDEMMEKGLLDEVRGLYPFRHHMALQTVGYTELFEHLDGKYSLEEAIHLIKRNTRKYAKRQITWFSRDKSIKWFHPGDHNSIIKFIDNQIQFPGSF